MALQRDIKYSSLSKKMREIFTSFVHTINRKTWCRARVWSIKAGKISRNRNKQHSTKSTKKMQSSRKKKKKSCFCFDTSLIQSFNIKFKVRALKNSYIFFVLLLRICFQRSCVYKAIRCWTVHRDERINYYSVGIRAKQSGAVKNVEHKNDYHECSK